MEKYLSKGQTWKFDSRSFNLHLPIREISAWEHAYQVTGEINTYSQAPLRRSPFERALYIDDFGYRSKIALFRRVRYLISIFHHADDSHGYVHLQPVDDHVRDADHYGEQISHVSHCCEKCKLLEVWKSIQMGENAGEEKTIFNWIKLEISKGKRNCIGWTVCLCTQR